jgi:hypothetical protein
MSKFGASPSAARMRKSAPEIGHYARIGVACATW